VRSSAGPSRRCGTLRIEDGSCRVVERVPGVRHHETTYCCQSRRASGSNDSRRAPCRTSVSKLFRGSANRLAPGWLHQLARHQTQFWRRDLRRFLFETGSGATTHPRAAGGVEESGGFRKRQRSFLLKQNGPGFGAISVLPCRLVATALFCA
jgi:hypothetical protein